MSFQTMQDARFNAGKFVCVGLDPDLSQIPDCVSADVPSQRVLDFLGPIILSTYEHAAAYKLQCSYYEALTYDWAETLHQIVGQIRQLDPSIPIILDYKRGDIDRTNVPYAEFAFDFLGVDAVTVHPYLGGAAMKPFLDRTDKTIFVLCRTSNMGASEFQDVDCIVYKDLASGNYYGTLASLHEASEAGSPLCVVTTMPMYQFIAHRVAQEWNVNNNCGVVVGATYPEELAAVRGIVGDGMPILIPGLGTQGGDLIKSVSNGMNSRARCIVLNNSSAILFAFAKLKDGDKLRFAPEQFAEAATYATIAMNDAIRAVLVA